MNEADFEAVMEVLNEMHREQGATSSDHLATERPIVSGRFANFSADEIQSKLDGAIPDNTRRKEQLAVRIFDQWFQERERRMLLGDASGFLVLRERHDWTAAEWNFLLKTFIFEVRRADGAKYNASSLKDIFSMLQHYAQFTLKKTFNFWRDDTFRDAREALNAAMKETIREGNVPGQFASAPIPENLEDALWHSGRLGLTAPKELLFTLAFYLGKQFALRGGSELHRLRFVHELQLQSENGDEFLVYCENRATKTNNAGINRRFAPMKRVMAAHSDGHDRCLPCIYRLYVEKRPTNCLTPALFLTWMRSDISVQNGKWYQNAPLGRHSLDGIVRDLTATESGAKGKYTNQSLRKTCATSLHRAGIPREDIARITGHSSTAIERYISFDTADHVRISRALQTGGGVCSTVGMMSVASGESAQSVQPAQPAGHARLEATISKKMRISVNGDTNTVDITFE